MVSVLSLKIVLVVEKFVGLLGPFRRRRFLDEVGNPHTRVPRLDLTLAAPDTLRLTFNALPFPDVIPRAYPH